MKSIQTTFFGQETASRIRWLIVGSFAVVLLLEYSTPPDYVFGYLYIAPILLTNARLNQWRTFQVTLMAAALTMANLWLPTNKAVIASTIASRIIAVMALVVTGVLSSRIRRSEDAIARQKAQLQSQEQLAGMREDFVSTLTHDLKTPLLGAIETIKAFQRGEFGSTTTAQTAVLDTMVRSHRTTLQMVETMLDIYRNDSEGLTLSLQPVDLASLAEAVLATLREMASIRRIHLSLNYGDSDFRRTLWVEGDALQLQRVFANLLTNSINHSPRGGRVEIVLESQPSYQVVKVLDEGQGITPDELPLLFERFYQGHGDRQAKGSGLGLYLTRQIIEAHHGTLWAENRSPQGALFGFRLPTATMPGAVE
ncbi:sensor histidine kinase [Stenomitos frigidus]|uniref:histidine kinase n=1 Tax=Stenomitos frigidus ULC18 TaxID=2107698 RepID=A0A2T1ENM8_9CYAN|nr:HAMP domain-containing sensor histidine kinase [Stenomitos frigidus]PSB34352.1 two-component sensor histidine kinase [Stenomitos frigidus ULC18]